MDRDNIVGIPDSKILYPTTIAVSFCIDKNQNYSSVQSGSSCWCVCLFYLAKSFGFAIYKLRISTDIFFFYFLTNRLETRLNSTPIFFSFLTKVIVATASQLNSVQKLSSRQIPQFVLLGPTRNRYEAHFEFQLNLPFCWIQCPL